MMTKEEIEINDSLQNIGNDQLALATLVIDFTLFIFLIYFVNPYILIIGKTLQYDIKLQ